MQERATGAIALRPTSNTQRGYLLISLTTRWRLNLKIFTLLTLPQDVINSVNFLERRNPMGLNIQDRYRRPFLEAKDGANDDPDNSTYAPPDEEDNKNGDERNDKDTNINPPPDQEMGQRHALLTGKTIGSHCQNAGVHQKKRIQECKRMKECTKMKRTQDCRKTQTHHRMTIITLKMNPLSKYKIQLMQ